MSQYNDSNIAVGSFILQHYKNIKGQALIKYGSEIKGRAKIRYIAPDIKAKGVIQAVSDETFRGRSNITTAPTSNAIGTFNITPFPKQKKIFDVLQDTFVDESTPSLNYGDYSFIQVGTNANGKRSRSFIRFDITSLPKNISILKANLVLYSQDMRNFSNLEIDSVDKTWMENSITWNGHPSRKAVVAIEQLDKNIYQYKFDITELVKDWYTNPTANYGVLLKAFDETVKQIKTFASKEHVTNMPKLEVTFLDSSAFIKTANPIHGQAHIITPLTNDALHGRVIIDRLLYRNKIRGKSNIFNQDIVRAKTNIKGLKDINGKAKIVYDSFIEGRVDIQSSTKYLNHISGMVQIPRELIKGVATISINNTSVHGKAKINVPYKNSIHGSVAISRESISGRAKIRVCSEVKGQVLIPNHNDVKGRVIIPNENNKLRGKINITSYESLISAKASIQTTSEVKGKVAIVQQSNIKGSASVQTINDVRGVVAVSKEYLNGKATIQVYSQVDGKVRIASNKDIHGRVKIAGVSDVRVQALIKAKYFNEIKAVVKIDAIDDTGLSYAFII